MTLSVSPGGPLLHDHAIDLPFDTSTWSEEFDANSPVLQSAWGQVNMRVQQGYGAMINTAIAGSGAFTEVRPLPVSNTYAITAKVALSSLVGNHSSVGIAVHSGANNKQYIILMYQDNTIYVQHFSNWVVAATDGSKLFAAVPPVFYLRIRRLSATAWAFYASMDGLTFYPIIATAPNLITYLGGAPDWVGLYGYGNVTYGNAVDMQYMRAT